MKYIIDTDPGIDDAIAIMLAYKNKLDIIGLTLASGNIPACKAENNLKVIQDFLGSNIKMYKGNYENECDSNAAYFAHGKDGLGYAVFPKNERRFETKSAEDFIIKSFKKYKDNLTMVCFGPLTNLANAIKKDKNLPKRIKHLVIMGSSYAPEKDDKYKEFNISVDPKAFDIVVSSGIEDIKMVTHEIGVKSFIEKDYIENLRNSDDLVSRFVASIAQKYMEFSYEHYGTVGLGTPDPTTVSSIIDPSIIKFHDCTIKILLDEDKKGESIVTLVDKSNIKVSTDFDLEKFRSLFKKTFK